MLAACLGTGGIPKRPVASAVVGELGLAGDVHVFRLHGGPNRAICLFAIEDYRKLWADGVKVEPPGAFGENVLTEGLEYSRLRPGDRLSIGDEVVIEIHDVREPCKTLKPLDPRFPTLLLGRSGFVCRVVSKGTLRPGVTIRKV